MDKYLSENNNDNIDNILNFIDEHSFNYFLNFKLDCHYKANSKESVIKVFFIHKLILLELIETTDKIIDKFIEKVNQEKDENILEEDPKNKLIKLLSLKDEVGNSPILYAAFKGNLKLIIKFIEIGVDYKDRNYAGLNVIHMASQGDFPNVLVYFREKYNMDLFEEVDDSNNNALHWACASGSKNSLDF